MNREIKFRAWDTKASKWIAGGDAMNLYHSASANCFLFDNDDYDLSEDVVFCQYTGLKDKNGKEIYEGDVVRLGVEDEERHVEPIVFHGGAFGPAYSTTILAWHVKYNGLEVIGNIYENPDLIHPITQRGV